MMLLRSAVRTQLAAVPLAAVLRPIDERSGARRCGTGSEASEPVRSNDLKQRCCSRGAKVRRHRTFVRPEPNRPRVAAPLESRDSPRLVGDVVQHPRRLANVAGLEHPP
jgi:hypothetical protein